MAKNRIHRINEEVQRELASLLRTVKDPRVKDTMLSITHVDTTTDLRYAKIYVSALDKTQEKEALKGLKSAAGYLRRELGAALSCATRRSWCLKPTIPLPTAPIFWKSCAASKRKKACWRRETKPHDD